MGVGGELDSSMFISSSILRTWLVGVVQDCFLYICDLPDEGFQEVGR